MQAKKAPRLLWGPLVGSHHQNEGGGKGRGWEGVDYERDKQKTTATGERALADKPSALHSPTSLTQTNQSHRVSLSKSCHTKFAVLSKADFCGAFAGRAAASLAHSHPPPSPLFPRRPPLPYTPTTPPFSLVRRLHSLAVAYASERGRLRRGVPWRPLTVAGGRSFGVGAFPLAFFCPGERRISHSFRASSFLRCPSVRMLGGWAAKSAGLFGGV